jgi:hypothetical protein
MTELELQKIMARVARECHIQRSVAIKRGIQRMRTKSGAVIAYQFEDNGSYVRLGRVGNEKASI